MQWSKLKTRLKANIAPELKSRIDFHVTSYRHAHDGAEKAWLTLDGRTVFETSYYGNLSRGEDGPQDFGSAARVFLDLPIARALQSGDPLVRALALMDRRVGKRRLQSIKLRSREHALVRIAYQLRRQTLYDQLPPTK